MLLEKFAWDEATLDRVLPVLWKMGELVVPRHKVSAVVDDPDDDRILECALSAQADVVVSGDRHLLRLGVYRSVPILSPREFLEMYSGE